MLVRINELATTGTPRDAKLAVRALAALGEGDSSLLAGAMQVIIFLLTVYVFPIQQTHTSSAKPAAVTTAVMQFNFFFSAHDYRSYPVPGFPEEHEGRVAAPRDSAFRAG